MKQWALTNFAFEKWSRSKLIAPSGILDLRRFCREESDQWFRNFLLHRKWKTWKTVDSGIDDINHACFFREINFSNRDPIIKRLLQHLLTIRNPTRKKVSLFFSCWGLWKFKTFDWEHVGKRRKSVVLKKVVFEDRYKTRKKEFFYFLAQPTGHKSNNTRNTTDEFLICMINRKWKITDSHIDERNLFSSFGENWL